MPIYEYKCDKCEQVTELFTASFNPPETQICKCGGIMERIISLCSFALVGDGWPGKTAKAKK
jgi:putative FmdB family regulatory protein